MTLLLEGAYIYGNNDPNPNHNPKIKHEKVILKNPNLPLIYYPKRAQRKNRA